MPGNSPVGDTSLFTFYGYLAPDLGLDISMEETGYMGKTDHYVTYMLLLMTEKNRGCSIPIQSINVREAVQRLF